MPEKGRIVAEEVTAGMRCQLEQTHGIIEHW